MAGAYLVYYFNRWSKKNIVFLISFAVGVLLANAFFRLLPEAASLTLSWPYWVLGTIVLFYLIEHAIIIHACPEEDCETHTAGTVSLAGIGFHSLVDGLTIGIAFEAGFAIGILASLAVIFHKLAEGGCLYTLLLCDNLPKRRALIYSWGVALATPFGALLAYAFVGYLSSQAIGGLLAAAAGSFIYIGASDLVPETHKKYNWLNVILLLAGVAFVMIFGQAV